MKLDSIITGDSAVVLQGFEPDCIDLTVTSPPYDNLRTYNGFVFDFETIARQLYRVTKSGGVVAWIVGDEVIEGSETCTSDKQKLFFREVGFNVHDTMIFKKENPPPQFLHQKRYTQSFEYMFIFSKGIPSTCNYLYTKNETERRSRQFFGTKTPDGNTAREHYKFRNKEKIKSNIWSYSIGNAMYVDFQITLTPRHFPKI